MILYFPQTYFEIQSEIVFCVKFFKKDNGVFEIISVGGTPTDRISHYFSFSRKWLIDNNHSALYFLK